MRQSQLFGKTLREDPKDEVSANAKLLERGGFVYKTMAGVYDYLPLGLRVLEKIKQIVREEMDAIGGQEVMMTVLQPSERWAKTGRWQDDAITDWFKTETKGNVPVFGLALTHEEPITEIALRSIFSYKDLPLYIYQIDKKFRSELRPKSGLIRGREFSMKDLYSFHTDEEDFKKFYHGPIDKAYKKVFSRCGLKAYLTEASGGAFTKEHTIEYQVFSEAGEDLVFYCKKCGFAQNKDISSFKEGDRCPKCKGAVHLAKSIEVGNIFPLGTKYSKPLGLFYSDQRGEKKPVVMGSYGIGISRLMGTVAEVHHDERGVVWPESIAPFRLHLIALGAKAKREADKLYRDLLAKGVEVLYDDREDKTAGEKFADADLIGVPQRVVLSERTLGKKGIEVKKRTEKEGKIISGHAKQNFWKIISRRRD